MSGASQISMVVLLCEELVGWSRVSGSDACEVDASVSLDCSPLSC